MDEGHNGEGVLEDLRQDYWRSLSSSDDGQLDEVPSYQYLIYEVGGSLFAFETCFCRQVFRVPQIVPVPQVPSHILGVINVRGEIVSVTSIAKFLGLENLKSDREERLIVIGNEESTTAVFVDRVDQIINVKQTDVQQVGSNNRGFEYAIGELLINGRLVLLLSVNKIFDTPEMVIDFRRGS